jgi:hypothetical protein
MQSAVDRFELIAQRATGHVAHDDVRLTILLAHVIDRHDGGMLEQGNHIRFTLKAFTELGRMQIIGGQDLYGDLTLRARVVTQVDGGHTTLTDQRFDVVTPDMLQFHEFHYFSQLRGNRQGYTGIANSFMKIKDRSWTCLHSG